MGLFLFNLWINKSSDFVSNIHTQLRTGVVEGTFEATTPCSGIKPPLPQIPQGTNCEMTIWKITFNSDKTYTLLATYGMTQPNATRVKNGGTQISLQGTWSQDPITGIVNLTSSDSQSQISFMKITDELIHLLDVDKKMMVGNGGWSYTLNKINSRLRSESKNTHIVTSKELATGVYEGRTPCQNSLLVFTKSFVESSQGCERIKWLITFYQDAKGNPTRYIFGIQGRNDSHQGTWHAIQGTLSNSEAIIYQLQPDDNRQIIFLLKFGDDHLLFLDENMNLLIGNKYLSYTLSKTADSYETRKSPLTSE